MYLIYNCGYKLTTTQLGKATNKWYVFKKRFVTEVDQEDGEAFLQMTSDDITWCPTDSKQYPPFMTLDDWCAGKEGRYEKENKETYDPEEYRKLFLLK